MNVTIKQAIYIIACSIIIGILFNLFQPHGITLIAKADTVSKHLDDYLINNIDIDTAKKFYDDGVVFIDARNRNTSLEGHINGAIPSDNFDLLLDELLFNHGMGDPLVIYCDNSDCSLSENLAIQLEVVGFTNIYIFKGGWGDWLIAGYPVEK